MFTGAIDSLAGDAAAVLLQPTCWCVPAGIITAVLLLLPSPEFPLLPRLLIAAALLAMIIAERPRASRAAGQLRGQRGGTVSLIGLTGGTAGEGRGVALLTNRRHTAASRPAAIDRLLAADHSCARSARAAVNSRRSSSLRC